MADVTPIVTRMRSEGRGLQDIADHLNDEGYVTRMGSTWFVSGKPKRADLERRLVHKREIIPFITAKGLTADWRRA